MNDELKDKELEDLWEWSGLKYKVKNGFEYWYGCNGNFIAYCLPRQVASIIPLTLDNLFKWAMPKLLHCKLERVHLNMANWLASVGTTNATGEGYSDDPAEALYLAIQKVRSQ